MNISSRQQLTRKEVSTHHALKLEALEELNSVRREHGVLTTIIFQPSTLLARKATTGVSRTSQNNTSTCIVTVTEVRTNLRWGWSWRYQNIHHEVSNRNKTCKLEVQDYKSRQHTFVLPFLISVTTSLDLVNLQLQFLFAIRLDPLKTNTCYMGQVKSIIR